MIEQQWLMGEGEFFTSTVAQSLKQTLDEIAAADEAAERIAGWTDEMPAWLVLKNIGARGTVTVAGNMTLSGALETARPGATFMIVPGHNEQTCAVKRCTCGGASVGGGHSHWCDIV